MKVARLPIRRPTYTVHDGRIADGVLVARCDRVRQVPWTRYHLLPGHTTTTCKRCLRLRQKGSPNANDGTN